MPQKKALRVMTYNIGGARKGSSPDPAEVLQIIHKLSPDVLAVQECIEWCDADKVKNSLCEQIAEFAGFGEHYFFGKTLSLQSNMNLKKAVMLYGILHDWDDWAQGNALYSRSGFRRLGDETRVGVPRNIPLYIPPAYQGTRDTDPRYAIIGRVNVPDLVPYVVCTHLTTMLGERGGPVREIPGKSEEAQLLRFSQVQKLVTLLEPVIQEKQPVILMGDFNAMESEACISSLIKDRCGFVKLTPANQIPTHPKVDSAVDHIFVFPPERILEYSCWIDDSQAARSASDHLPVIADIVFA